MATKLMRTLNSILAFMFFHVTKGIIQTFLGVADRLGSYFVPLVLVGVFASVGIYFYRALRN